MKTGRTHLRTTVFSALLSATTLSPGMRQILRVGKTVSRMKIFASSFIEAVQKPDARPISDLMNLLAQVRPSAVFSKTSPGIQ
jgi:hypothetical protein